MCPELSWWTRGLWRGPDSEWWLGHHHKSGWKLHPRGMLLDSPLNANQIHFSNHLGTLSGSLATSKERQTFICSAAEHHLKNFSGQTCKNITLCSRVVSKSWNFPLLQCICFLLWVNFSPVNSHKELWKVEFSLSLDFANRFCSDQWGCSHSVTPHEDGKGMRVSPSHTCFSFPTEKKVGGTAWEKIL